MGGVGNQAEVGDECERGLKNDSQVSGYLLRKGL